MSLHRIHLIQTINSRIRVNKTGHGKSLACQPRNESGMETCSAGWQTLIEGIAHRYVKLNGKLLRYTCTSVCSKRGASERGFCRRSKPEIQSAKSSYQSMENRERYRRQWCNHVRDQTRTRDQISFFFSFSSSLSLFLSPPSKRSDSTNRTNGIRRLITKNDRFGLARFSIG